MLIFFNINYFRTDHSKSGNIYIIKKKKKKTQLGDKANQHHLHHKRFGFIFWIARLPQIELKLNSGLIWDAIPFSNLGRRTYPDFVTS